MIPVRLTLLLLGTLILFLLVLGNPLSVRLNLLFWSGTYELYKIIVGSVFFGVILTLIYIGHVKYLRRIRSNRLR